MRLYLLGLATRAPEGGRVRLIAEQPFEVAHRQPFKFATFRDSVSILVGHGVSDHELEPFSFDIQDLVSQKTQFQVLECQEARIELYLLGVQKPIQRELSKRIMKIGEERHQHLQTFLAQRKIVNRKRYITKQHHWQLKFRATLTFANKKYELWLGERASISTFYDTKYSDIQDDTIYFQFEELVFQQFNLNKKLIPYKLRTEEAVIQAIIPRTAIRVSQVSKSISVPIFDRFSFNLSVSFEPMTSSFIQEFAGYLAIKPLQTRSQSPPFLLRCYLKQSPELSWSFQPIKVEKQQRQYVAYWNTQYAAIQRNNPAFGEEGVDCLKEQENFGFRRDIKPGLKSDLQFSDQKNVALLTTTSPFACLVLELCLSNSQVISCQQPCLEMQPFNLVNTETAFLDYQSQFTACLQGEKWSIRDATGLHTKKAFTNALEKRKLLESICFQLAGLKNMQGLVRHGQQRIGIRVLIGSQSYRFHLHIARKGLKEVMADKDERALAVSMRKQGARESVLQQDQTISYVVDLGEQFAFASVLEHQVNEMIFEADSYLDMLVIELFIGSKMIGSSATELGMLVLPDLEGFVLIPLRLTIPSNPLIIKLNYKIFQQDRQQFARSVYQVGFKVVPAARPYRRELSLRIVRNGVQYIDRMDYSMPIKLDTKLIEGAEFCLQEGFQMGLEVVVDGDTQLLKKEFFVNKQKQSHQARQIFVRSGAYETVELFFNDPECPQALSFYLYVGCRGDRFIAQPLKQLVIKVPEFLYKKMKRYGFDTQSEVKMNVSKNKKSQLGKQRLQNYTANKVEYIDLGQQTEHKFITQKWYENLELIIGEKRYVQRLFKLPRFSMLVDGQDPISRGFRVKDKGAKGIGWFWSFIVVDGKKFQFLMQFRQLQLKIQYKKQVELKTKQVKAHPALKSKPKKTNIPNPKANEMQILKITSQAIASMPLCKCLKPARFMGLCESCINKAQKKNLHGFLSRLIGKK